MLKKVKDQGYKVNTATGESQAALCRHQEIRRINTILKLQGVRIPCVPSFPHIFCFILWLMLCAAGYFDQRKKSPTQKTGEACLSSDRSGSVNDVRKTRSAVRSVKQSDSNRRRKSLGLSSLVTVSITVMGRSHRPRGRDKTALSRRVGGVNKPLRIGANQAQADQGRLRPYRTTLRAYKNS